MKTLSLSLSLSLFLEELLLIKTFDLSLSLSLFHCFKFIILLLPATRGDSKKNSLHDATPGRYVFWKKIYKKVRK
jgi:hypothetical protein